MKYETPTKKQQAFVEEICQVLDIQFPLCSQEFTKYTYSKFISGHLPAYRNMREDWDADMLLWCGMFENDAWTEHY